MAGEYVRWLARNEKPEEVRELTPQEKRRNWWDYHKWHVVLVLILAVFLGDLVFDAVRNRRNQPDYVIAYVGETALPDSLARVVESAFCQVGQDVNGNGKVQAELRQFVLTSEEAENVSPLDMNDPQRAYAASMLLQANIEMVESMVFLLEDPELFHAAYPILCRADGSDIDTASAAPVYYHWGDCPVLAELELEHFEVPVISGMVEGDSQLALSGLAVARRGLWEDGTNDAIRAGIALWERITEGAK